MTGKISRKFFEDNIINKTGAVRRDVVVPPRNGVDVGIIEISGGYMAVTTDPIYIDVSFGLKKAAETEFVHIVYYPDRKRHDFSFYTNINVNKGNVREIAETYRERWGIENGYLEKKDVKERTHSPDMGVRHFLFYLSVLVYNMWVLLNLIRRISGYGWITLMDFIISMGRGKLNIIMKGNGWSTVKANKLQAFDVH